MTILERPIGDVTILDINGRITVQEGADTFHDAVQRLVSQDRVKLVLNLPSVPYIDSTALGDIVWAFTTLVRRGGLLKLVKAHAPRPRSAGDHEACVHLRDV